MCPLTQPIKKMGALPLNLLTNIYWSQKKK